MKKFLFFAMMAVSFFSLTFFSSCKKEEVKKITTVSTIATMTNPTTNGFLISQEMVVKGNTVWGFSKKAYGTGTQWRDIVAQNPFLQQPGRVYYNEAKKMWVVKIYPGEVVKIGGDIITPSCVFEETTTTVEETEPPKPIIPWWIWLLIVLLSLVIIGLFVSRRNNSLDDPDSSIVHVDMNNRDINFASQKALDEREESLKINALKVADKVNISSLDISLEDNKFVLKANYFEKKDKE